MKKALVILVGASMAFSVGCFQAYDLRISDTVEKLKYLRDLNKNTEEADKSSKLVAAKIYIRAPKGLKRAQTFTMAPIEQGKFDVAESFIDTSSQATLHILARSNAPKPATKKEANPAPTAARGDFTTDVVDLVKSAYSTELDAAQLKPANPDAHGRKPVQYRSTSFEANGKRVEVYFHGAKGSPAQVALIFEGPPDALKSLLSQINYSLNSLAVGPVADSRFRTGDDFSEEAGAAAQAVF